ncbi:hypothetical protein N9414_04480 [Nodularia spumigena CCY9414]|uniref:hypothetical protein n=1 Tax=Nodularia spumigena TaxID=70799 RepID=UPI0000EAB8CA|nr:hypothetical protein [Nodularia spumigena]EAW47079.1 hypothetical protein N9414_04480 [Nodularia spumigena CCY9414]
MISPVLSNIGLHGLENYIKALNPKLGVVRYADDFIVTARDIGTPAPTVVDSLRGEAICSPHHKMG